MTSALKIVFAIYAVRAAFIGIQTAVRFPTPNSWLVAAFSLCLLPVAWGLIREKKWAWNAAAGLAIFRFLWSAGQIGGMFFSRTIDTSALIPVALRQLSIGLGVFLVIFVLLILARRSYQTAFAPAANQGGLPMKTNDYVRPVFLGVTFLVIGLLMFVHPLASSYSPILLRSLALILVVILWAAAVFCFFERKARMIRPFAFFATATAATALLGSLTFYAYFALAGLLVSGVQFVFGIAAIPAAANARLSFVD